MNRDIVLLVVLKVIRAALQRWVRKELLLVVRGQLLLLLVIFLIGFISMLRGIL